MTVLKIWGHLSGNEDQDEDRVDETKENESQSYDVYMLPSSSDNQGISDDDAEKLSLAPIEFTCGSFEDPYEYIGDSDLIFVFSSCMSSEMMSSLSEAFGRQCKPGTIIITTDYSLPLSGEIDPLEDDTSMPFGSYELELLESVDGYFVGLLAVIQRRTFIVLCLLFGKKALVVERNQRFQLKNRHIELHWRTSPGS
jgi:hypothetical protein